MRMLALLVLALPVAAEAGQRRQSFRVGAVVIRSARLATIIAPDGSARVRISPGVAVSLQPEGAPPRIESAAETALPAGTTAVTVHY
jgi:hypothetical protein